MWSPLAAILAGLFLLAFGGEALVRGATRTARILGLAPAVIGLTVVAMGTSLPELVVSFAAATRGEPDIAVTNVIGSNILNLTATLGLTALVMPLPVRGAIVQRDWPVMCLATIAAVAFMRDAAIGRVEGGLFLLSLVAFTAYSVRITRREATPPERTALEHEVDALAKHQQPKTLPAVLLLLLGFALLIAGGEVLVRGAVALARYAGMSERVIGLTVVSIGTGAPEIASSLVAAARRETDIAVGNLIGSNIFNILAILGVTALWRPIAFTPTIVNIDLWWMLGTALMALPIFLRKKQVTRAEGAALVVVYVVYIAGVI